MCTAYAKYCKQNTTAEMYQGKQIFFKEIFGVPMLYYS